MWLARVDLADWINHKVRDLSRGMQQKVQFIASFIHDPQLLILDEPFQNLDPVNVALIKEQIQALQAEGKTIVLSAHQMNLVEALCDRILLINHGRSVLYGTLNDIKAEYAPHVVRLRTPGTVDQLPGVTKIERKERTWTLTLDDIGPQDLLRILVNRGLEIELFEVASAPLEEIFIAVVREETHA
jgi:ABC-2 type transport system ATP-binding protein